MFDSVVGEPPSRLRAFLQKLPTVQQVGVAILFVFIGWGKFDNDPRGMWVQMFEEIGLGQWFRYLTGAMQVGGGILVLFRKTLTLGAGMLACTMVGAAIVDVAVVGQPVFMIIPLLLLIVVATTWATSVNRSR